LLPANTPLPIRPGQVPYSQKPIGRGRGANIDMIDQDALHQGSTYFV
jgi:hypothetical protein